MSMMLKNWQRGSSRRNRMTVTMSRALAVTVSSPRATANPATAPVSASLMVRPSFSSASAVSILWRSLPLDRSDPADFLLQQHHAIEQRLRRGRATGNVDVDRNDSVAAAHHRIGIVIVAAAIG